MSDMKVEQELRRFVQSVADASPEPPLINPASATRRRVTPAVAFAGAFVGLLVIVGVGTTWMFATDPNPPAEPTTSSPRETDVALTPAEILADGVVTETEYRGAVSAVVACLDEQGFETTVEFDSSGVAGFDSTGEGVADAFDPCFAEHLGSVALIWASQNASPPGEIAFYNDVVDCVEAQSGASYGEVEAVGDTRATDAAISDAPDIYHACLNQLMTPTLEWLLVSSHDPEALGMLAQASGSFEINVERRCVYFNASNETIPSSPVIFAFGTILVDSEPPHLQLPDGTIVQSGENVSVTGGWIPQENVAQSPLLDHLAIPETCWRDPDQKREVLLISPFLDAIGREP